MSLDFFIGSTTGATPKKHMKMPIVTVDVVLVTVDNDKISIGILEREKEPFKNQLALPGMFVNIEKDKNIEDTAKRILNEKIGINNVFLEQLETISGEIRDPRGWSISVVYYALISKNDINNIKDNFKFIPYKSMPMLAFDHNNIIEKTINRIRSKTSYSTLAAHFLPEKFTIAELHNVYQIIMNEKLDAQSFRRKVLALNFLKESGIRRGNGRPAQLYQLSHNYKTFTKTL